jgi:perosamine synthetase
MPTFKRFDPLDCRFPAPRVPLLPVLRWDALGLGRDAAARALDGAGVRHFSRARYAMREAYRLAGVGPSGALLAPSYHCRTMFDSALALGGEVLFYVVDEQLLPDLASIARFLALAASPVKAVVVTHYFGFRQPPALMDALAAMCREHGVTLVEDCSHAWQVALEQGPACEAQPGRMVVASPYKFFAAPDGGTLWGNPAQLGDTATLTPTPVAELKALVHTLARARAGAALAALAAAAAGAPAARGIEHTETGELISNSYQPAQETHRGLALSRWIVRHSRMDSAATQRRAHYRRWLEGTSSLVGVRPLFPEMSADCAPYMFPLLVERPDPHFFQLKQLGVPIWRWDDVAVANCAVAASMRLHLLHLPCHQSLSDRQLAWMISSVTAVVTG